LKLDGKAALAARNETKGADNTGEHHCKWKVVDDPVDKGGFALQTDDPAVTKGKYGVADIVTKKAYRDFRLHIEFLVMNPRGNSGVYLQNRYEIQIQDGDATKHGMGGVELIERIVPLIPPVYANLTRFHGVFAPTSRLRAKVVPRPEPPPPCSASSSSTPPPPKPPASSPASTSSSPAVRSSYRLDWAALLKRVFAVDVMVCSRCDGPMKVIAFLEESNVVQGILTHLGLHAEPLPAVNAQAPPTTVEMFDDP
jgi:hypothetical protein